MLVFDCQSFLGMSGICLDGNWDLRGAVRRFTVLLVCLNFLKSVLQFWSFLVCSLYKGDGGDKREKE